MSNERTRMPSTLAAFGVIPAAAVLVLTAPGAANASGWTGQGQYGNQSNATDQNSSATSGADQYAPAGNYARGLWGAGRQAIGQANGNSSDARSGNVNGTVQRQDQKQYGAPIHLRGQGQGGDQSNSTGQNSSATSRAIQVAPATNVNVGTGDQTITQANRNSSSAASGNSNATGQEQAQGQAAAMPLTTRLHRARPFARHLRLGGGALQGGGQSNATRQNSAARSGARQYAPAYNAGGGAQRIVQGDANGSRATSGNGNLTGQHQVQVQGLPGIG
jgi:hypothetical protein